jgi:hypothetical protein
MPRGFEGVRSASADLEARRGSGGGGNLWFRLRSGQETVVRFLEQDDDIAWAWMHTIEVEGRSWGRNVPCLDQERDGTPCPGCERDMPRKFQGYINVIWDDAPVFKRDSDNKIVKDRNGDPIILEHKPQVVVWSSGIRLFEELDEINANYRGLSSRRFKVKRKGEKLDTKYHISPEDVDAGAQPMTAEEEKLAEDKYDLSSHVTPGTYESFLKELGDNGSNSVGHGQGDSQQAPRVNPFLRKQQQA